MQQAIKPQDYGIYGGGGSSNNAPLTATSVELIIFQDALNQPATPSGGAFVFASGSFTPPVGWLVTPPTNPFYNVWVSTAVYTSTQPNIVWNTPGRVAVSGGGGSGTVTQVLGTANDITVTPATPNSANYTLDLANVARNDTTGTTTNMAITAVNTDTKGRITGVQVSPILGNQGTVTQVTAAATDITVSPTTPNATTYNLVLAGVTRTDNTGATSTTAITALSTDSKGRVLGVTVSPVAGSGGGNVSNVSVIAPLSGAMQFVNQATTPQLQIVNASSPSTQYLGGDGSWTVPRGMGTIIGVDNVNFPGTTVELTDTVGATFTDAGSLFTVGTGNTILNTPYLWNVENLAQFKQIMFSGSGVTTSVVGGKLNVVITGGGGGGGSFSMVSAIWTTANSATKNAYSAQPTINNDGISISLTASSNPGTLTTCRVSLNGTQLTNTYNINGTFPNYTITIPVADLNNSVYETASTVTVLITIGTQFSLTANNLINIQPIPFTTALTVNYVQTSVPYFNQVADIAWSYTNSAQITSFGGNVLISGITYNFTAGSGTLSLRPSTGGTIGGSATGFGLNGAPNATINFSGNLPAVPTFTPAFYQGALTGATPPTFAITSPFTNGDPIGRTITFTQATASAQYVWVATTYPSSRIYLVTALGNATVTPNIIAPQQNIAGTVMNVFGYTGLSVSSPVQFVFV